MSIGVRCPKTDPKLICACHESKFVTHLFCGLFDAGEAIMLKTRIVGILAFVNVVLAVSEHAVNELGELACGGENRNFASFAAANATEVSTECGFRAGQRDGGEAEGPGDAIGSSPIGPFVELLATRDGTSWRKPEP